MNIKNIKSGVALIMGLGLPLGIVALQVPAAAQTASSMTPAQRAALHTREAQHNEGVQDSRQVQKDAYYANQAIRHENHDRQELHNNSIEAKRAAIKAEYYAGQRAKQANHMKQHEHNLGVEAQRAALKAAYYKTHPKK